MNDYLIIALFFLMYFSPVLYQLGIVIKENKKGNKIPLKRFKKILKISLAIIIPISIAFGVLTRINFLDYEKPLTFDKYDQITFANFRGLEFFKKSLYVRIGTILGPKSKVLPFYWKGYIGFS